MGQTRLRAPVRLPRRWLDTSRGPGGRKVARRRLRRVGPPDDPLRSAEPPRASSSSHTAHADRHRGYVPFMATNIGDRTRRRFADRAPDQERRADHLPTPCALTTRRAEVTSPQPRQRLIVTRRPDGVPRPRFGSRRCEVLEIGCARLPGQYCESAPTRSAAMKRASVWRAPKNSTRLPACWVRWAAVRMLRRNFAAMRTTNCCACVPIETPGTRQRSLGGNGATCSTPLAGPTAV